MKYLLDTHSLIWFIEGDSRSGTSAKEAIENADNDIYLSIGSPWEISIKNSLGKLSIKRPYENIIEQIDRNEMEILPITFYHTVIINKLPFHHKDPFDRLIAAQAIAESLTVIGKDEGLDLYGVKRLW
ncbi:MAG: type II toxin-antitoxin system VapC family toxin [Bacteroidetes bacterium]|nr:MAG: type II toxin-antitoxin system VapC family toxin [Bacteroidota bacterium]